MITSLLLLVLLATAAVSASGGGDLQLVRLPAATVQKSGARCLDGSPPAYFVREPTSSSRVWLIGLQGGGWCYTEADCVKRARTRLG